MRVGLSIAMSGAMNQSKILFVDIFWQAVSRMVAVVHFVEYKFIFRTEYVSFYPILSCFVSRFCFVCSGGCCSRRTNLRRAVLCTRLSAPRYYGCSNRTIALALGRLDTGASHGGEFSPKCQGGVKEVLSRHSHSQSDERSSLLQPESSRVALPKGTMNRQLLGATVIGNATGVEQLVQQGARVDATLYRDGRTCLHVASSSGNVRATQTLIQNRANIESKEEKG